MLFYPCNLQLRSTLKGTIMTPDMMYFIMKHFGLVLEYKQRIHAYALNETKLNRVKLKLTLRKLKRLYKAESKS